MIKIATIFVAALGILGLLGVHAPAIASSPSLAHGHDMASEALGTVVAASFESPSGVVEETADTCPAENDHHSGHSGCCSALASCVSGCGSVMAVESDPILVGSKSQSVETVQWISVGFDATPADPPPRSV